MQYFLPTLALIFITLKLTGIIAWSWWYVTMPLWGGAALIVIGLMIYFSYLIVKDISKN